MNVLITICARGGSKGIPGKNIRRINGKPLIAYSIEIGRRLCESYNACLALSTDDQEIKRVSDAHGLSTAYTRPANLATDSAGKIDTIADLLYFEETKAGIKYDYIIDLDVTSPLRTPEDITKAFDLLARNKEAYNIFSVSPPRRNPYFNMVEEKANGFYGVVKSQQGVLLTRQTAPAVYEMNASFYIYRRVFFDDHLNSAITERSMVYVVPHQCFDLDHPEDFEFMEYLIANNKLDFQL